MESNPKPQSDSNKKRKKQSWKDKQAQKRIKKNEERFTKWMNPDQHEEKKKEDVYELHTFTMGNHKFDAYYQKQLQFMGQEEFKIFVQTLQEKLPVTFRINQTEVKHEEVIAIFRDKEFIRKYAVVADGSEGQEQYQVDMSQIKLEAKKYYPPGNVLFELTVPRELLKKNPGLKAIHKLVQKANDAGLLTRQEIVSMLPPLLLDIQAEHAVFDMCAAPGSKTAQVYELMRTSQIYTREGRNIDQPEGFIVANDADPKRAFLLTHQMNRLNSSNILILNHNAQNFPSLTYKTYTSTENQFDPRVLFDRIVCDVPCSSDAAIRKIPQKWQNWHTNDGGSLHPLQQRILFRGLQLLKVGGLISYSTCSLNPIEDEAVVASALHQFAGSIELVKVEVPDFKFRPGLTDWKVMVERIKGQEGSTFVELDSYDTIPEEYKNKNIKDTMFRSMYNHEIAQELTKCLRVLPHDQDTSGFFITIIKKIKDFDGGLQETKANEQAKVVTMKPDKPLPLLIQKKDRNHTFEFYRCDKEDPDIQYIAAYYGLPPDFPFDHLITQSSEMNKLYFVSPALSRFLYADCNSHLLNLVNCGVPIFMRNSSKFSTNSECIFRISQDGVLNLIPYMTKRLVKCQTINEFKFFLMHKNITTEQLPTENSKAQISELSTGCFVLTLEVSKGKWEAIVMHKFPQSVNMMVSREKTFSLQLRYLTKEERESVATLFEQDK